MKLRNKKDGEIVEIRKGEEIIIPVKDNNDEWYELTYTSITELNSEWEDAPEEPKELYWVNYDGSISHAEEGTMSFVKQKHLGNYFETKEEAEQAVEKLKAWKRLKDKGLAFCSWKITDDGCSVDVETTLDAEIVRAEQKYITDDLNLLFGGEE